MSNLPKSLQRLTNTSSVRVREPDTISPEEILETLKAIAHLQANAARSTYYYHKESHWAFEDEQKAMYDEARDMMTMVISDLHEMIKQEENNEQE